MDAGTFIVRYFSWHFGDAFNDLTRVFFNLTWFVWRLFSIPELAMNFFVPFQRLEEKNTKGTRMEDRLGNILVTIIMRIVGAIMRLPIILLGAATSVFMVIIWLISYAVWALLPIYVPFACVLGILVGFGLI